MATKALVRVVEREARVFRRLWRGSIFTSFVTPVLFLSAMGLGLGGLVDESAGDVQGLTYLAFVTPGLLAASAMLTAAGDSLWPVMAGQKWMRVYHAMVASPIPPADVHAGHVAWTALRVGMSATAFLVVAALMGGVGSVWGVLAVPVAMLTAAAFAAPLAAFSATQERDVSFPMIMRIGVVPLFLFSGTFFPVSQLPAGLQPLAALSPLWHGVQLARAATTGTFEPLSALAHVAVLVAVTAAGLWWGGRTFTRRLAA